MTIAQLLQPAGMTFSMDVVAFGAGFLLQSTLLICVGLLASRWAERRGAVLQSTILRATLVAVVLAPVAALGLSRAGVGVLAIRLPQPPGSVDMAASTAPQAGGPEVRLSVDRAETTPGARAALPTEAVRHGALPQASVRSPLNMGHLYLGLAGVWLVGSFVLFLRLLGCYVRISIVCRSARPAGDTVRATCAQFAEELGTIAPEVRVSRHVATPCLLGLFRPVILLPDTESPTLTTREVILHELAHLVRRDCLWNLLSGLLTVVFCYQPLAWMLGRLIERTGEQVADDTVLDRLDDRRSYARVLLYLAERFLPTPTERAAAVTVVSLRSALGQRVHRILDTSRTLSVRASTRRVVIVAVVALCGTLLSGLVNVGGDKAAAAVISGRADSDDSRRPVPDAAARTHVSPKGTVAKGEREASKNGKEDSVRQAVVRLVVLELDLGKAASGGQKGSGDLPAAGTAGQGAAHASSPVEPIDLDARHTPGNAAQPLVTVVSQDARVRISGHVLNLSAFPTDDRTRSTIAPGPWSVVTRPALIVAPGHRARVSVGQEVPYRGTYVLQGEGGRREVKGGSPEGTGLVDVGFSLDVLSDRIDDKGVSFSEVTWRVSRVALSAASQSVSGDTRLVIARRESTWSVSLQPDQTAVVVSPAPDRNEKMLVLLMTAREHKGASAGSTK